MSHYLYHKSNHLYHKTLHINFADLFNSNIDCFSFAPYISLSLSPSLSLFHFYYRKVIYQILLFPFDIEHYNCLLQCIIFD